MNSALFITKKIQYFSEPKVLACDACCEKAWGINSRPCDENETFLFDDVLGRAPTDPGTYEGSDGKPLTKESRLNKWCARECERSILVDHEEDIFSELKMKNAELSGV